ncbi:hypothetical protein DL93DRAFT_1684521 [Clavulina sp. PMI_390]|nr:hypothetical protein DL93DRAFT_1684521 [Clavulina sp. PMI_390]
MLLSHREASAWSADGLSLSQSPFPHLPSLIPLDTRIYGACGYCTWRLLRDSSTPRRGWATIVSPFMPDRWIWPFPRMVFCFYFNAESTCLSPSVSLNRPAGSTASKTTRPSTFFYSNGLANISPPPPPLFFFGKQPDHKYTTSKVPNSLHHTWVLSFLPPAL